MAESPVPIESPFPTTSIKSVPNGHNTPVSHDSNMASTTATTNGTLQTSLDELPSVFNSFEDSFIESIYDDDFVDPTELARLRHLSTIVEGAVESSNSSSDNEDDDYIRLNQMSVVNSQALESNDTTSAASHMEGTSTPTPTVPLTALPGPTDSVTNHDQADTGMHEHNTPTNDEHDLVEPPQSTTPTQASGLANDYDEVETFHEPTVSLDSNPTEPVHEYQNINLEATSAITLNDNDPLPPTTTNPVENNNSREAASPNGFLAVLTDALASPPVLNSSQTQEDSTWVKGVLEAAIPPSGEWLLPEDQMSMDMLNMDDQHLFFPNLLPTVAPIEQCSVNEYPCCIDSPSRQNRRGRNDYVNVTVPKISTVFEEQGVSEQTENPIPTIMSTNTTQNLSSTTVDTNVVKVVADTGDTTLAVAMDSSSSESQQVASSASVTSPPQSQVDATPTRKERPEDNVTTATTQQAAATSAANDSLNLSNLDRGVRTTNLRQLAPTLSSPGGSPVMLRRRLEDSPLARRKNITSSPVSPRRELGILQPLSPEHGTELTEQYNFLRRTLSHSNRRYSTRRRPNHKGRSQEEGASAQEERETERLTVQSMEQSREAGANSPQQRRWREILISSEVSSRPGSREGHETRVDHLGRTYYMNHQTRTIAFDNGQRQSTQHNTTDLQARRQMLDRRYQSLNRSFRSNERPSTSRRRHSQRPGLTPSLSNNLDNNMSLTLTREEAEAMLRGGSTLPEASSRGKSKKKRSTSGSGRKWPFGRKSSKSIVQQGPANSSDDVLMVSPSPIGGDIEFRVPGASPRSSVSPQRSTSGSVDSENSLTRSSGAHAPTIEDSGVVSMAGGMAREEVVSEQQQGGSENAVMRLTSPEISDLDRGDSIVRSSWLSNSDRAAAIVARRRATTRLSEQRDSEEATNEVTEPRTPDSLISPIDSLQSEDEEVQSKETGERRLSKALASSPTLKFITRRDLFTFLSSAGAAGRDFIASRALMELVQRIRSDNILLEKYQHSRHLVNALNRFADEEADLPDNWEKKLNQQGKVFFIDHKHKVTTFIDPRLPLPDSVFTYTTQSPSLSITSTRRSALFDERSIRSHHVTTVGTPVSEVTTPISIVTTPTSEVTTPTTNEPSTPVTPVSPADTDEITNTDAILDPSVPPTYEAQVVAFFRRPDVIDTINSRYHRGVRPQFRNIIEEIRQHGIPALERIQLSGSIAAYELALVLSLFEEDIARTQLTPENTTAPTLVLNPPQPSPQHPTANTKNTLQRTKEAFSTKLQHFKIMMVRLGFSQGSRLKFNIRRDHLLEDSYEHIMKSDIKQLQTKRLNIAFKGEDGLDYGGPSREFFFLLSREIFNPYYGLFEYSANDTYTVQVNPTSEFLQNSQEWFRFAGRVVGLVIVQGFLLDAFFTRTVYKTFLSRPPNLKDLEALEPAFYNSLLWIRENDPEPLDLTFTVEEEAFGELRTHELKEGGLDLLVTEDNKEEYISLMLKWRLDRGVAKQMEMLKKGFSEVMPPHLLVDFDAHELEFITAGTVEIDVEDWRKFTEYRNGYHPAHPVVGWFWKAVESFTNEQRLRLLQFVTGTSSVPFEGFKALRGSNGPKRFTIDYYNDINAFPRTHTCFNRIDLPPYPSYETLYDKLLFAVQEGGGFGIE